MSRIIEYVERAARRLAVFSLAAAFAVFLFVQDRVTAAGARRYVALQRAAAAGRGPAVTIDEVMRPAVAHSVRQGLLWASVVAGAGLASAAVLARRRPRA